MYLTCLRLVIVSSTLVDSFPPKTKMVASKVTLDIEDHLKIIFHRHIHAHLNLISSLMTIWGSNLFTKSGINHRGLPGTDKTLLKVFQNENSVEDFYFIICLLWGIIIFYFGNCYFFTLGNYYFFTLGKYKT